MNQGNDGEIEGSQGLRLRSDILDELKKRSALKKEVIKELTSGKRVSPWLQQVSLVLITFFCTGVLGAYLTNTYQTDQWNNEQALLTRQRELEQKYQVANQTAEAIGEIHAGTIAVLSVMQLDDERARAAELRKIVPDWKKAKRDWLVRSSVLVQQIGVNFPINRKNPLAQQPALAFQDIFDCYHRANVAISNMIEVAEKPRGKRDPDLQKATIKVTEKINSNIKESMTRNLMTLMASELERKPSASEPQPSPSATEPTLKSEPNLKETDPCGIESYIYKPKVIPHRRLQLSSERRRHR